VRPVFVGDVQGCADELQELLDRGDRSFGREWEPWLVGDLLNRGPANLRVLTAVRERVDAGRARVVLGNHDLAFVRTLHGLRAPSPHDTLGELLEHPDANDWAEWLRRLPVAETGTLGGAPFAMVHAAVHPEWDLSELVRSARAVEAELGHADRDRALALLGATGAPQDLADVLGRLTRCRSVGPGDGWSSLLPEENPGGVPLHGPWLARGHDYGVVYGHWALQGLHVAPGLRGLDTGCVHHGRDHVGFLTAWLPDPDDSAAFAIPDRRFWQVRARRRYYPGTEADRDPGPSG
jgi:bis(5'-nucleosyl)-tetraphosphatase (symmetrical)